MTYAPRGRCVSHADSPGLLRTRQSEAVVAKACELDLEGIVGKQDDSPYQRGKRPTWVKIKNPDYSRQDALRKRS